jgi:aspartyl-tRNA synthetase
MEGAQRYFDKEWQRTVYCGDVSGKSGEELPVVVNGWVRRRRDLGGLIFIE